MKIGITNGGSVEYYSLLCDLYAPFLSKAHLKDEKQWLIWIIEAKKHILCGIISLNKKDFIQIAISPSHEKKGIGKEALIAFKQHTNIAKIGWTAHRANYPSLRLLFNLNGGIQRKPTKRTINLEGFFRWNGLITKKMKNILEEHLPTAKQEFTDWLKKTDKHRKELAPQISLLEATIKFPQ